MMYSLTFPLPLNFIQISLLRRVLVSALSFFAERFSISARKSLALVIPSDTVPLKASGMPRLMIIRLRRFERSHFSKSFLWSGVLAAVREGGCSVLNARSRSMQPRTMSMFSFQSLKLAPFRMGILFAFADISPLSEAGMIAADNKLDISFMLTQYPNKL